MAIPIATTTPTISSIEKYWLSELATTVGDSAIGNGR